MEGDTYSQKDEGKNTKERGTSSLSQAMQRFTQVQNSVMEIIYSSI